MRIKRYYKYYKEYGLRCFLAVILSQMFPYNEKKRKISWSLLQHKHKVLLQYLTKHYYPVALNTEVKPQQESQYKDCIWTAWLQGEENAPESIKMTLASIRKYANGHKVIVLTDDTVDQLIDIPEVIKEKHRHGIIGNAHYADVIRMMILAKYGGLWLDATTMLNETVDEGAFTRAFYSVAFPKSKLCRFVSGYKWLVGAMGGKAGSVFLNKISDMLNAYWREHGTCIDYFVFDYLVMVLYQNDSEFAKLVDNLPQLIHYSTELRKILNKPYDESMVNNLLVKGELYHITYKMHYEKHLPDGKETVYGHLYRLNNGGCEEKKDG